MAPIKLEVIMLHLQPANLPWMMWSAQDLRIISRTAHIHCMQTVIEMKVYLLIVTPVQLLQPGDQALQTKSC